MTQSEAVSFPAVVRSLFQRLHGGRGCCHAHIFSVCLVARDSCIAETAKSKAKNTPAHQGKFLLVPSSPCASAFTAHTVKGRYALCSTSFHYALDLLARLQPSLLTTAAPREISPQSLGILVFFEPTEQLASCKRAKQCHYILLDYP